MTIPESIATAIIETAKQVDVLGKSAKNQYADYDYVPIDDYYEQVARTALEQGISWITRETECRFVSDKTVCYTFAADLFHTSGENVKDAFRITIPHALQGAQTAGSALSYAEKVCARDLFKVVTGEKDADATDPNEVGPILIEADAPEAKNQATVVDADGKELLSTPSNDAGWQVVHDLLVAFIPDTQSADSLIELWRRNSAVLERMEKESADRYERVLDAFRNQRKQFGDS